MMIKNTQQKKLVWFDTENELNQV